MEEHIEIIEKAIFEFEESGRASKTAMARYIVGELEKNGYTLSKLHQPTVSVTVCEHKGDRIFNEDNGSEWCCDCKRYISKQTDR